METAASSSRRPCRVPLVQKRAATGPPMTHVIPSLAIHLIGDTPGNAAKRTALALRSGA
jgi:hypothetical protein